MEVLDSECETWEPLPNPPSRIAPSGMVSVVLEHTKQILLTLLLRNNFEVHYDYYGDCVVTYMMSLLVVGQNLTLPPSIYVVRLQ